MGEIPGDDDLMGDASEAARRQLDVWSETGAGDPRAERLQYLRQQLGNRVDNLNSKYRGTVNDQGTNLCSTLVDIYHLATSPTPNVAAYVQNEFNEFGSTEIDRQSYAAAWYLEINMLINSLDSVVGASEEVIEEFKQRYQSQIWQSPEDTTEVLGAIADSYEIIKIFTGRETAVPAAGSLEARREAEIEDKRVAAHWLEDLQAEIVAAAGVAGKITRSSNNSSISRRKNKIKKMLERAKSEGTRPGQ